MKTTELTDTDGDALTITQRLDGTWITCTKGAEEVTIGPIPTDAIRNAFEQQMGGDDMDGGVTAALIEREADPLVKARDHSGVLQISPQHRAAIRDRNDARAIANDAVKAQRQALSMAQLWKETARELFGARNGSRAALRHWQEKYDHPLTADDITDEMVVRFWNAFEGNEEGLEDMQLRDIDEVRTGLSAALTPPPPSPEGAEEIAEVLRTFPGTLAGIQDISEHLASRGVRVTGGN